MQLESEGARYTPDITETSSKDSYHPFLQQNQHSSVCLRRTPLLCLGGERERPWNLASSFWFVFRIGTGKNLPNSIYSILGTGFSVLSEDSVGRALIRLEGH
ncbi:hypothetical protein TNCV_2150721 [Trichonephila clavipes]|nr:hypothetical protein TNCV_2150721 [Trichonephila clavipes]